MISSKFNTNKVVDQSAHEPGKPINGQSSFRPRTKDVADQQVGVHDPFALENLRLPQDFGAMVSVKKVLTNVPCRKPHRREFVRVRPGNDWRLETIIFEDKVGREMYLVDPQLREELASESFVACLRTVISRQGNVFLWPVRFPAEDGRSNSWNDSAIAASLRAEEKWIRIASNMSAGSYEVYEALGDLGEPNWPDLSFQQMLRLCFQDRLIRNSEHPILRDLRGEA